MYLKSDITLSDFDDLLFIIKTTAALSQWNNIFLFLNSLPQRKIANAFHFIKVTNALKYDLLVWIQFLDNFNGITYIHDNWITNIDL
jgi:hypothetical protein